MEGLNRFADVLGFNMTIAIEEIGFAKVVTLVVKLLLAVVSANPIQAALDGSTHLHVASQILDEAAKGYRIFSENKSDVIKVVLTP